MGRRDTLFQASRGWTQCGVGVRCGGGRIGDKSGRGRGGEGEKVAGVRGKEMGLGRMKRMKKDGKVLACIIGWRWMPWEIRMGRGDMTGGGSRWW